MEKIKEVKIITCTHLSMWYENHIGEVFAVVEFDTYYQLIECNKIIFKDDVFKN